MAKTLGPKIRIYSISPGGIKRKQSKRFIRQYQGKGPLARMASRMMY